MPQKRSNGEGSIYKNRSRNRWEAALVVGRTDTGRLIRRRFTARTRAEVTRRLDDAKRALDQGLGIPDPTVTVAAYARWWQTEVLPGEGLAPKTERWYGEMLDLLLPVVGHRTLTGPQALTPADVEALCARQRTARTADAVRTTLSKMLRSAEARGLIARNAARLATRRRDRGKARPVKALTVTEVAGLLGELDGTRWHPVALVGVTTGLRPAELLALHWPDVDLVARDPLVAVRLAFSYVDGIHLKAPKRGRSYRTVPLVPEAAAALKSWRKVQAAERLAAGPLWSTAWPELVFTTPAGVPHRVSAYWKALTGAVKGAHPHRLRHTYATHLLEAGTPIHHVAELLGDTVGTVEDTYSHVLRAKHEVVAVARGLVGGGA